MHCRLSRREYVLRHIIHPWFQPIFCLYYLFSRCISPGFYHMVPQSSDLFEVSEGPRALDDFIVRVRTRVRHSPTWLIGPDITSTIQFLFGS